MIPFVKSKSDKADAVRLHDMHDKWQNLKQYSVMDELHNRLKPWTVSSAFMKHKTAWRIILLASLTKPILVLILTLTVLPRSDGSQKWVDFASTYWHVDCVIKCPWIRFISHYQNWCKRKKYNFSQSKAEEIYGKAKELVPVLPKDAITKHYQAGCRPA